MREWVFVERALDLEAEAPGLYFCLTEEERNAQGLKQLCLKTSWAGPGIQFHHSKSSAHFLHPQLFSSFKTVIP